MANLIRWGWDWAVEYWKLYGAYGELWRSNEQEKAEAARVNAVNVILSKRINRVTSDNERLLSDNNRLRTENTRLRQESDTAVARTEGEIVDQITSALRAVQSTP